MSATPVTTITDLVVTATYAKKRKSRFHWVSRGSQEG